MGMYNVTLTRKSQFKIVFSHKFANREHVYITYTVKPF